MEFVVASFISTISSSLFSKKHQQSIQLTQVVGGTSFLLLCLCCTYDQTEPTIDFPHLPHQQNKAVCCVVVSSAFPFMHPPALHFCRFLLKMGSYLGIILVNGEVSGRSGYWFGCKSACYTPYAHSYSSTMLNFHSWPLLWRILFLYFLYKFTAASSFFNLHVGGGGVEPITQCVGKESPLFVFSPTS